MKVMTALLLFVAILFLPVIALAQGNGAALSKKFDSYLDTSGDKGGRATPPDVIMAQGKCKSDPVSAIPVPEKASKAARPSLPSRGQGRG